MSSVLTNLWSLKSAEIVCNCPSLLFATSINFCSIRGRRKFGWLIISVHLAIRRFHFVLNLRITVNNWIIFMVQSKENFIMSVLVWASTKFYVLKNLKIWIIYSRMELWVLEVNRLESSIWKRFSAIIIFLMRQCLYTTV